MIPPVIIAVIEIIEMLLSVTEGNRHFSVSYSQTGSIIQDLALAAVLRSKAAEYLNHFDIKDARIYLVYHHWMGAFPKDKNLADSLIHLGNLISILIHADKVIIKTRDEAFGIPEISSNVLSIRQSRYIKSLFDYHPAGDELLEQETELLGKEVDALMDRVLNFDGDSIWRKTYNAIKDGVIDVPFSPHRMNRGKLVTVRDRSGRIRIHDAGQVPIPPELLKLEMESAAQSLQDKNLITNIIDGINYMTHPI
jgi:methylaspartate mutase epsilon subunit